VHNDCLPLLRFITERGNVTVFEWRCGKQPMRVEAAEMDFGISDDEDEAEVKDADNGEVSEWHLCIVISCRIVLFICCAKAAQHLC